MGLALLQERLRGGVEGAENPLQVARASRQAPAIRAPAPRCSAFPSGRSSHSSRAGRTGRCAPQPACVTGPRQGMPCTITQTVPRCLHSMQTLWAAIAGLRPARNAEITSSELHLVDRDSPAVRNRPHMRRNRRRCRKRVDVLRRGIDGGDEFVHVGEIAQCLDAAGGGAGADGHQELRLPPDLANAFGIVRRW